ncbi:hypothetical protein Gotri_027706, partial [Gossypium trilobum]|nr:hypothetical protein [Gossypium trilobum]
KNGLVDVKSTGENVFIVQFSTTEKLPVRIHLSHVLLELYTTIGLSYIASALGIPLYMDSITAGQQRLSYVKVYVKMAANLVLPRSIDVELRDNFIAATSIEELTLALLWHVEVVLEANRFKDYGSLKTKKSSNKGKQALTGSSNRFAILETVNLVEDQIIDRVEIERFEHTEIGKIGHGE